MDSLSVAILICFVLVWAIICLYGLHRYWMVWLFLRTRDRMSSKTPGQRFETLPSVTVQLPMFNERRVASRIIEAACALDYPAEKLQIQVLDDSTDDSADVTRECCQRMGSQGHDIEYRHRLNRTGYKAGALADGFATATGELIAVFDADFVPPADFLQSTVHHFTDLGIGMVQTRWGHLNRDQSILTRVQAILLDSHFVVEQTARARNRRWFNFNGTAGIWRRRCIDEAGGWQHDTLTEDTDLSYRAQLAGWKFEYLPDVVCPAEIPPTVSAFMGQQHRWNKGLTQTAIKLLPRILRSRASVGVKFEALFHLTCATPYIAVLLLVLLALPALLVVAPLSGLGVTATASLAVVCLIFGFPAASLFCVVGQVAQRRSLLGSILMLPAVMAIGVGVNVLNTRAAIEALLGRQSPFVRTPKFAGSRTAEADPVLKAIRRRVPDGIAELALAALMVGCAVMSLTNPNVLIGVPFLVLFAVGYFTIGLPSLRDSLRSA